MTLVSPSFETPSDLPAYARRIFDLYSVAGGKLSAVAAAVGVSPGEVERISWRAEPVFGPDVYRIDASAPDAIPNARLADGLRWERIAYRAGLSVATVQGIFRDATGLDPKTTKAAKGRPYAETRFASAAGLPGLPAGPETDGLLSAVAVERAADVRGDRNVARRAALRAAASPALRFPVRAVQGIGAFVAANAPAPAPVAPVEPAPAKGGKRAR